MSDERGRPPKRQYVSASRVPKMDSDLADYLEAECIAATIDIPPPGRREELAGYILLGIAIRYLRGDRTVHPYAR